MKNIILLIVIANFSFAQNCKLKVDKIDEFTKERIIETKRNDLSRGSEIWFESKGTEQHIGFYYQLFPFFSVDETSKIIFLDDKGNTKELSITKYMVSSSFYNSAIRSTIHNLAFTIKLDDQIKEFLKNSLIVKMRFITKQGDFNFDVKEKNLNKLKESLNCLDSALIR